MRLAKQLGFVMMDYVWIVAFILATMPLASSQSACNRECRCVTQLKRVYCNERDLTSLPYGIPQDTEVLFLQGNKLQNSPDLESKLSDLLNLRRLHMNNNQLTSFPSHLPGNLTYVSLTGNRLKYIGKTALKGLTKLRELELDWNNLTSEGVSSVAFQPAGNLEELVLAQNDLTSVPLNLPTSLRVLRLDHNKINIVSSQSLRDQRQMIELDLQNNNIADYAIEESAFRDLVKLQTLDLSNNHLVNIPKRLPQNMSRLLLSGNRIQYIYATSGPGRGDLQTLRRLTKLDLSSNQLRSVEKGAFTNIPSSASVEIHNNPWRCDCNLVYLKTWFSITGSVDVNSNVRCSSPYIYSDVTLGSLDVEDLRCSHSSYAFEIQRIAPSSIIISYDASTSSEPPYVSFSVMYGEMLCQDCEINSDKPAKVSTAAMWMEDYTILPISSLASVELGGLKPRTRYAVCIVASYQHPDQIGLEQCDDIITADDKTTVASTLSPPPHRASLPLWVYVVTGLLIFMVVLILTLIVVWRVRSQSRKTRRYCRNQSQIPQQFLPSFMTQQSAVSHKRNGLPIQNANKEFDVTLMVRPDANVTDSCYSDSHDDTTSTVHTGTGTMTSRTSHHIYEHLASPSDNLLQSEAPPVQIPMSSSGLMVWFSSLFFSALIEIIQTILSFR